MEGCRRVAQGASTSMGMCMTCSGEPCERCSLTMSCCFARTKPIRDRVKLVIFRNALHEVRAPVLPVLTQRVRVSSFCSHCFARTRSEVQIVQLSIQSPHPTSRTIPRNVVVLGPSLFSPFSHSSFRGLIRAPQDPSTTPYITAPGTSSGGARPSKRTRPLHSNGWRRATPNRHAFM